MNWKKIIFYVKNEGSNLNIMIIAMKSIMKCETLGLNENFHRICFNHLIFLKHVNMLQLMKKM